MALKELAVAAAIGIPIGLGLYHLGIFNQYLTPFMESYITPIIPHIHTLWQHIQQNKWAYLLISGLTTATVGFIFNTVYKKAKAKTAQVATQQFNNLQTKLAGVQQTNLDVEKENVNLREKLTIWENTHASEVDLHRQLDEARSLITSLEKERDILAEQRNVAWRVGREVKEAIEEAKHVS